MLPVAGPLLNIAAVSLSTAVDGFYALFWTTAGLRGTSIMGGGLSRIWLCTVGVFTSAGRMVGSVAWDNYSAIAL